MFTYKIVASIRRPMTDSPGLLNFLQIFSHKKITRCFIESQKADNFRTVTFWEQSAMSNWGRRCAPISVRCVETDFDCPPRSGHRPPVCSDSLQPGRRVALNHHPSASPEAKLAKPASVQKSMSTQGPVNIRRCGGRRFMLRQPLLPTKSPAKCRRIFARLYTVRTVFTP